MTPSLVMGLAVFACGVLVFGRPDESWAMRLGVLAWHAVLGLAYMVNAPVVQWVLAAAAVFGTVVAGAVTVHARHVCAKLGDQVHAAVHVHVPLGRKDVVELQRLAQADVQRARVQVGLAMRQFTRDVLTPEA